MRVLLVDDHPAIRSAVRTVLDVGLGFRVVGEAATAERALRLVEELEPDLVVLDLRLGREMSGIRVCRHLKALPEPPYMLAYTAFNSAEVLLACRVSDVDGFVHKSEDAIALLDAIEGLRCGERTWLLGDEVEDPEVSVEAYRRRSCLTPREEEVFYLLLQHRTNPQIAEELHIGKETVKTHVSNLLKKLGWKGRRDTTRPPT